MAELNKKLIITYYDNDRTEEIAIDSIVMAKYTETISSKELQVYKKISEAIEPNSNIKDLYLKLSNAKVKIVSYFIGNTEIVSFDTRKKTITTYSIADNTSDVGGIIETLRLAKNEE